MIMKMVRQYESPLTMRTQVQVEKGFMKASVISKDDHDKVESAGHEIGSIHDAEDWRDGEWK